MGWKDRWRDRRFPPARSPRSSKKPALPRKLGRALAKAARKDVRQNPAAGGLSPDTPRTDRLIAGLPEATRRHIAWQLQRERPGRVVTDWEERIGQALAATRCGWTAPDAAKLFSEVYAWVDRLPAGAGRPVIHRALVLPLAALEELPADERKGLLPHLRHALAIHYGCATEPDRPGSPSTAVERALPGRLRELLGPGFDVDANLPADDGFAAAARCALGAGLYKPGTLELFERCAEVRDPLRPPDAWLGRLRETVPRSGPTKATIAALLGAAVGRPHTCATAFRHRAPLSGTSGRLLGALAWAACVSDDLNAVRTLGGVLAQIAGGRVADRGEGAAVLLRAGLTALAALAGEPPPGEDEPLFAHAPPYVVAEARTSLRRLRWRPEGWDEGALVHTVGPYTALLEVTSAGSVALVFRNRQGETWTGMSSPVSVRHPVLHTILSDRLDEVRARVAAYREQLTDLLGTGGCVPAARWRAEQLDDPVLEPLARALVWQADLADGPVVGLPMWRRRSAAWVLRDMRGRLHELPDRTPVGLWDARMSDARRVRAWQGALKRRGLAQPVPQLSPPAG